MRGVQSAGLLDFNLLNESILSDTVVETFVLLESVTA